MDTSTLKTTADYLRAGRLIAKYADTYAENYNPALSACLPSTKALHEKDVELMQIVAAIDAATSLLDMSLMQSLATVFVDITDKRSLAYRRVIDEYGLLKLQYPAVIWPELLP